MSPHEYGFGVACVAAGAFIALLASASESSKLVAAGICLAGGLALYYWGPL